MADMKKLIETVDSMSKAENNSTGPKFPGYWKGTDPASKAKGKMVGGAEESLIKDLHNTAKKKVSEWTLEEDWKQFKEQDSAAYTGIDPIVRQRMGMQPASQEEIRSYLDKNPPLVKSGSGEPVKSGSDSNIISGGQTSVAKAADIASPDRAQSVAGPAAPAAPTTQAPTALAAPAAPTTQAPTAPAAPTVPAATVPAATPSGTTPTSLSPSAPTTQAPSAALAPATVAAKPEVVAKPVPKVPEMPKTVAPGSWQDIWKNNPNIKNPNLIRPGQEIKLPNGSSTIVDKGDTLSSIAQRYRQGLYNPGREVPAAPATPVSKGTSPASSTATKVAGKPPTDQAPMGTPAGRTVTGKEGPATSPQPAASAPQAASAAAATPQQSHPAGTMVSTQIKNPKDPTTPLTVTFYKKPDGTWSTFDNAFSVKDPKNTEFLDKQPAFTAPYGATAKPDFTEVPLSGYTNYLKGPDGEWYRGGKMDNKNRVVNPALKRHLEQKAVTSSDIGEKNVVAPTSRLDAPAPRATAPQPTQVAQAKMPAYLLNQIPEVESGNNPAAVSPKGAIGAWQTMPSTLRDPGFGIKPAKDTSSAEIARSGQDYAHAMFNRYGGNAEKALAAYNAGPGRIDRAIQQAAKSGGDWKEYIPRETQAYLSKFKLAPTQAATIPKDTVSENIDTFVEDFKNFINGSKNTFGPSFRSMLKRTGKDKQVKEFQNRQDQDAQITSPPAPAATQASQFTADMDIVGDDEKEEATMEADAGAQDPNKQATSPASPIKQAVSQQQAAQKKTQDERQDLQTALGTVSSIKPFLGPKTDVNQAASAITKISNNQPLTKPEGEAISGLTPLVMKAAETPSSAAALKTALTTAGVMAKQGK